MVGLVYIKRVEQTDADKQVIEQLSHVLTYSEPENFDDCVKWWKSWFSDKIPGEKLTIIAQEQNNIIGVARLWKTPFCDNKWLIEGLEVIPNERRKGIGKSIVIEGIRILRETTNERVFVHIANKNIPSIKLHERIGFKKVGSGIINSYGDFRGHVSEYALEI
ncbi:Ribosomal protein S18 acetylase RimI [Hathewaya proteolytica DSM 3090]|uniref:Ribosomal protein S18 acetylase RimI n=1 Tax=Hathewaya proteolytica DSM 3090 TaxID=1121331 RepID=A0A1M6RAR5_9CLOT|nr:GNAT family N-acetyltransferase [Hathewaya proteolytica]SHK29553.1 Ribosomal protein S18 acetylase RimI [Hathewaya proteolytica DSM 3090]